MGAAAVVPRRRARLFRRLVVVASVLVGALLTVPQPASAAGGGTVYVVHGLTGKVYDVFVDGKNVCPDAKAKTVVGPLSLASGEHLVEIRDGGTVVTKANFTVSDGSSTDLIAHPLADASSAPEITAFRNDLARVGPGKARLAVAHTASAPPADIRVDGKVLFSNVANGEGLTLVVPAKTYGVDIVPTASSGDPILGPVSLKVKAGTLTRVFAIGSVGEKSMDAVVHVIPIRQSGSAAPNRVATGDGGQAATSFVTGADPLPWTAVALLAAAGLLGLAWNRRPRPRPVPFRRTREH